MAIEEFILLNRSQKLLVVERLGAVVRHWQAEWWPEQAQRQVELDISDEFDAAGVNARRWLIGNVADATVWVGLNVDTAGALACTLVGYDVQASQSNATDLSVAARGLERAALEALVSALLRAPVNSADVRPIRWGRDGPQPSDVKRNHGLIVAHCHLTNIPLLIVLNPVAARRYLTEPSRRHARSGVDVIPLATALGQKSVILRVHAGSAELGLSELASLSAGDVICLDRRLAAPLPVSIAGDTTLCRAHLGTTQNHKAVQLTAFEDINEV